MRGVNRVIIAGNLARDPDVRYTVNKKAFARFTIVVNSRYRDANGEYQETADFINVVAWGNNAEVSGKYLKKGSPVLIEGRIKTGSYEAKDGSGKRYTTEIWIDNLTMLGSRQNDSDSFSSNNNSQRQNNNYGMSSIPDDDDFGKSIGESEFGDNNFNSGFADNNEGSTVIPF